MIHLVLGLALAEGPDANGELRAIETLPGSFPLDVDGRSAAWGPVVDTRARLGMEWAEDRVRAGVQADLLTGQLLGDTWSLSPLDERNRDVRDVATFQMRRLVGGLRLSVVDVELGLVTSHWGLGLVANDGAHDPWFGRSDFGDRTIRLRLATKPAGADAPLFVVLAADQVLSDELTRASEGDDAKQVVAAVLYHTDREDLGVYGVRRIQLNGTGRHIHAWVVDATGRILRDVAPGWSLEVAGEGAAILGTTDVQRTYQAVEGIAVRSYGGVATAELKGAWGGGKLKLAYASGDRSSDDDVLGSFRFDRDLDVGMVLFDEVLSQVDLAAIEAASDPELSAVPPDGVDSLATEGAFGSAFAIQPVAVALPLPALELRLGGVFAWSTAPIQAPLPTFRAGGVPTNHAERSSEGRYLGSELDWAIASRLPERDDRVFFPSVSLQGGHAWPSAAYSGLIRRADLLLVTGRLRW